MSPVTPANGGSASASGTSTAPLSRLPVANHTDVEPSPASTYGVSDTLDDVPQTPDTDEGVLLTGLIGLGIRDEGKANVKIEASGAYYSDPTKATGKKALRPGTELYSPPFVRNGTHTRGDDPFQSATPFNNRRGSGQLTPKMSRQSDKVKSEKWRSGSSNGTGPNTPSRSGSKIKRPNDKTFGSTQRKLSFHIREHISEDEKLRAFTAIKAESAQGVFPPSCCVFVANLLQSESEEALEVAVTQVFRQFGPVYVKIRRDAKHMPFAFCQYTLQEHADRAIREGRGRLIRGRPCRCEKAKAHRVFSIERKYGTAITPAEAQQLFEQFGTIELCCTASTVDCAAHNLNEGVIVQFKYYDDGQNAYSAFRNSELYKMQPIAGLVSPTKQIVQSSPETASGRAYLARYDIDRRSIFVGNLPLGTSELQIRQLFEPFGVILDVIVRENASKFEPEEKFTFAFVEFGSPISVVNAISSKNGFSLGGKSLRVAQKDSETSGNRRAARSQPVFSATGSYSSPSHRVNQQTPVSPMVPVSPVGYSSPASYSSPYVAYSPYLGYGASSAFYTDASGRYFTTTPYNTPYSPAYYSQPSSPTGSPSTAQTPYYGYNPYQQYSPVPYWGMPTTAQQPSTQATYYPPAYSPSPAVGGTGLEDRSATPTPNGHGAPVSETLESN